MFTYVLYLRLAEDSHVGWCGRMGPLSVGPPRNLQPVLWRQLRGLMWAHGSTFRGPSPQSPICTSETAVWADAGAWVHFPWALPAISMSYYYYERDGLRGPMGVHERMVGRSPPTSLNTNVSCRGDRLGHWGLDGRIGRAFSPHPFCMGYTLED